MGNYKGEYKDGKYHGQGTMIYDSGEYYNGEYNCGLKCGNGVFAWPDNRVYEGGFKDDVRCGHGIMRWPDGSTYEGEWKDDKRHGVGICRWADGRVYNGEWQNDEKHGAGTMRYADGSVWTGVWTNGKKAKETTNEGKKAEQGEELYVPEAAEVSRDNIIVCWPEEEASCILPYEYSCKEFSSILNCNDLDEAFSGKLKELSGYFGVKIVCVYDNNAIINGAALNAFACNITADSICGGCIICAKAENNYAPLSKQIIKAILDC